MKKSAIGISDIKVKFIKDFLKINYENKIFLIGIFLSLSAPIISSIFLISSIVSSFYKNKLDFLKNIYNRLFIASTFIVFISCLKNTLSNDFNNSYQSINIWIGFFRWLIMVVIFCSLDIYVKTDQQKKYFAISIISGSIPLLITGLGQYFFNWFGPWEIFNGLITWYLHPSIEGFDLMGVFSNSNYAGAWLVIITPFLYQQLLANETKLPQKLILIIITTLVLYSIYLTNSRNAYIGIILILIILSIKRFSIILSFISGLFIFSVLSLYKISTIDLFKSNIQLSYYSDFLINTTRFEIFKKTFLLIKRKPLFGWGYESFPIMYPLVGGVSPNIQHPHNLVFFWTYNFGLLLAALATITISILVYKSFVNIYKNKNKQDFINKTWIVSTFVFLLMNLNDISYLEGRLSVISWILLAGTKSIASEKEL